ncbi:protein transport protein Sec31A isoform X1 [Poecilia latipinna]|uniref:protein transport protein Sec31A isoform X1 n=1 Tax=Poecilia latipinna TaxID=48699 RepID=UPI00072E5459|nr:PREDICTED: protein transport protein Sec31A isoform X1 [Poecilia latipinna]XP_014913574.1 PREDICTED: protein transport protein Sec31A isoform X1 [Poecilia latipinna]
MKLKEINRTAIQSWSPAQHHPIYLATGTSAQQLDASFSTNASLELFELDLADPSLDMKSCGSLSSAHRYHKLVWGPYGMDAQGHPSGVLIAGGENGNVILYDAAKIVAGESDVIVAESVRHTGPVRALDVNHFQSNLVASGGNESEIYIWDMNNFGSPMTPGPKAQPQEDISCVAWNKQVQHILASACPSGRASVWDLRKNDLIIKVSDHSNRMHCSGLAWNPEVATQLVLASEDDRLPVIQMWDLRFASSPLKILEQHTRGVLAIAWSLADPELLLSCGKDSRILCWNPNTGEVLYELPTSSQWCFDIQWCPRNPAVLSAAGFDGHIDIYSIMGGSSQAQSQRHADQISNSFGNLDPFGTGQPLPPLQLPQTPAAPATVNPLKKPPKWIRRPVGASFAFGGKLVSLENAKPPQPQQPTSHVVHISQVVTETAFLERSDRLQATLSSGGFVDFCQEKISSAENEFDRTVWSFLKVNFESDVRSKYLELLGYNKEDVASKISAALEEKPANVPQPDLSASTSPLPSADLSLAPPADTPEAAFDLIAASNLQPAAALHLNSTPDLDSEEPAEPEDGPDSELDTNMVEEEEDDEEKQEEEEEIPLNEDLTAQVEVEESSPVETPAEIPPPVPTPSGGVHLSVSKDVDGLITQALLTGDFQGAVELCLHDNRMADSIILAIAGGADLLEKTQRKYFTKANSKITKLISAVVMKDWHDILKTCDLQNWREAMAAVMTYARPEEFSSLCDLLGSRLEAAEDLQLQSQACLCYICAGNVEKLVSCWSRAQDGHCPLSLQDLVEKVVVLRRAVELTQQSGPAAIGILLAEKMSQYASLLASQGGLSTAITYLPDNTNQVAVQQLRDRLIRALGQQAAPAQTHRAASQLPGRPPLPQHPFPQVQPALVPQPAAGVPAPGPTPASAPSQPQYYQPVRAASTVTSWSNQTPTAFPPPPLPHVGSTPDQQAEPPNPMYGLPASSTPAAPSASSTPGYMYSHQYQPYPQVNQYPPGAGGVSVYQPLQYSSTAPPHSPPAEPSSPPHPPGFLAQYTQPVPPPLYPGQPPAGHSLSSSPPFRPPFFPSSSSFSAPPSSGASFQHGGPGSPVSYMPPPLHPPPSGVSGTQLDPDPGLIPASKRTGPQNGWNDPPALTRAPKKKQVPQNYTPPAPITAPILAPLGADPQAQPMSSGGPQDMLQGLQGSQVPYSGMHQTQLPSQSMNASMPNSNMEGAPGAPTGDAIQPLQSIPAEKIMKKPIPDEHLVLKTTFEGLIQKCLAVATDPQTKRKLDDANKRLEALYDKLREQTLSPAIIGGLHSIVRTIESRSYTEGLNIHTHIVGSSNFSETSAFMPVLKVVLTQANKLGV